MRGMCERSVLLYAQPEHALEPEEDLQPLDHLRTLEGGLPRSSIFCVRQLVVAPDQFSEIERGARRRSSGRPGVRDVDGPGLGRESPQATQRPLIDRFVAEAIRRDDPAANSAHRALRVPAAQLPQRPIARDRQPPARAGSDRRQLSMGNAPRTRPEPLAIRSGLLRQLNTVRFRPEVRSPRGSYALVIGDPAVGDPDYPALARRPRQRKPRPLPTCFAKLGYSVVDKDRESALKIVSALFAQEYRIIHIAAHGGFNEDRSDRRGVVIGKDRFLTAAEIGEYARGA